MILFLLLPFSHHAAASPYSGAKSRDSMTGNNNFAESNILGLDPQFALSRAGIEGWLFGVGDLPHAAGWRRRSLIGACDLPSGKAWAAPHSPALGDSAS